MELDLEELARELEPDREERDEIAGTINTISEFMREKIDLSIQETFKGGSYAKHTMLTGKGDVDTVFYLEPRTTEGWKGEDFRRELRAVYHKMQTHLQGTKNNRRKFRAIGLKLNGVETDVLLGLENVRPQTIKTVPQNVRSYVRPSVSKYQVEWWKEQGGNYHQQLNKLARIGKYWIQKYDANKKLCPSYALEVMSAYACKDKFDEENLEELFTRLVKWMATTELNGKYFFRKYYQEQDLVQYPLNELRLYDPADPTNNLSTRYNRLNNKRKRELVEYAKRTVRNIEQNQWNFLSFQ